MEVEREGGGWEEEEEEGGLEKDTVRGCLVLGPDLEGKKESQFANLRCKAHTALPVGMHETSHRNIFVERKNERKITQHLITRYTKYTHKHSYMT